MMHHRPSTRPEYSFFFTVSLRVSGQPLLVDRIDDLRAAYAQTWLERPFRCDAMVVLPDHLHAVWTLPPDDQDFSCRWRLLRTRFQRASRATDIWQREVREHRIRDQADMMQCLRRCWDDPVRHGVAASATDWPFSSLHRDMRQRARRAKRLGVAAG